MSRKYEDWNEEENQSYEDENPDNDENQSEFNRQILMDIFEFFKGFGPLIDKIKNLKG